MLTISQIASYAGVTVAAIRHYHRIGLLAEPDRDHSGYRSYDAADVVRLIEIHTLASAGVPLSRVEHLIDAEPAEFASEVAKIDARLRTEIRRLTETRRRLAGLVSGEQLALPASVVGYLNKLRGLGVSEPYLERERDAWIVVAAQLPEQIDSIIAQKVVDLEDPDVVQLYRLVSTALEWTADDRRVVELADTLYRITTKASGGSSTEQFPLDDQVVALLDAAAASTSPAARRLFTLLEERGLKGLTRFEPIPRRSAQNASSAPGQRP